MRITDAKVIICSPGRNFVTLKITTEDGIHGLGDATVNGRELAVASYLSDHVVPLLIGRDARRIEDTWQYLYKGAYWRRGPVTMAAIGAVDTALWDIRGKTLNTPVYQLLGGASRDNVLVYGHANGDTIDDTVAAVGEYVKLGYRADSRAVRRPGRLARVRRGPRRPLLRAGRKEPADRVVLAHRALSQHRPAALRAAAEGIRARRPPPPRLASPAHADRGGETGAVTGAASSLLARGRGARGAAGRLPHHPPAHDDAARGRRSLQRDSRLPTADQGAAHRLHPNDRRAQLAASAISGRSPRSPNCTT